MKVTATLKMPDALEMTVDDFMENYRYIKEDEDLDEEHFEEKREEVTEKIRKYFQYGEYITVEFDIDKDSATVVSSKG